MGTSTLGADRVVGDRTKWLVVLASFATLLLVRGSIATYGNFIAPLEADFGWSRTTISLTFSVFLLATAVASPLTGRLIDLYGARSTLTALVGVVAVCLLGLSLLTNLWQLYVLYALIGFCVTALSLTHLSSIVTKWFDRRALLASGIAMSGFSIGQLVFNPVAAELIVTYDWRVAYRLFGLLAIAVLPVVYFLVRSPPSPVATVGASPDPTAASGTATAADVSVSDALRTRSLWLLIVSFFICGFTTVGLITTHLVPYLIDVGFSSKTAADGAGLLGGMTVFGLLALGALGDRFAAHKGPLLAAVYLLRGLVFLYLIAVATVVDIFVFAALYGFFYYGTVPLHTGITADRFGKRNLTTLVGIQYAGHQVGGATAAFLAGWVFDVQGSYLLAHLLGAGLLLAAAVFIVAETRVAPRPSAGAAAG